MSANLVALLYLVSGVLFIMALRGLASPETSRQGNRFGMIGMAIAILTTLSLIPAGGSSYLMIFAGLAIGGGIGAYIANKIPMTAMPQLVAAFHSLVGLAAVFVAAAALNAPAAFGIGSSGNIDPVSLFEMSLGRSHWRHHLYRFDYCVFEARWSYVWRAHHVAEPPFDQYGSGWFYRTGDLLVHGIKFSHLVLAACVRRFRAWFLDHHPDWRR